MTIEKVEPGRKVRIDKLKLPGLFPIGTIGEILNTNSSDTCIKVSAMNNYWFYDKTDLSYLPDNDNNPKYLNVGTPLEEGDMCVASRGQRFPSGGFLTHSKVGDPGYDGNYIRPSQIIKEESKIPPIKYRTLEVGEWIMESLGDEKRFPDDNLWRHAFAGDKKWKVTEGPTKYRRPIRTTSTIPTTDISSYPIEDLIEWRDKASVRVSRIDKDINYVRNIIKEQSVKFEKLQKQRQHDIKWIVKLNRILYNRVIKERGNNK